MTSSSYASGLTSPLISDFCGALGASHNTKRIFRDVYDGIEQYIGDKISNNSGWVRAVLFVLPDYRIRICELTPWTLKTAIL